MKIGLSSSECIKKIFEATRLISNTDDRSIEVRGLERSPKSVHGATPLPRLDLMEVDASPLKVLKRLGGEILTYKEPQDEDRLNLRLQPNIADAQSYKDRQKVCSKRLK